MFQLFSKKSPHLLGIDIGTTSVRLLELSKRDNGYQVERYGIEYLPDGAVFEKEIKDVSLVGETITKLVKQTKPSTVLAAVAIPTSAVISKVIQFPANMSEYEVETQLEFEAEKYIPYSLEEVSLDFEIQGTTANNPDVMDVLLVASKTEHIDSRVEALELGGLKATLIDTERYAVERGYALMVADSERENKGKITAIFDIGATITTLDVVEQQAIIYSREQNFGGRILIEEIQRRYELSYQEAYLAKQENQLPKDYEGEVLTPYREAVLQQIRRCLQLFYSSTEYHHVDEIVLAGGSAGIANLIESLKQSEGVPAVVANPLVNMSIGNKVVPDHCLADAASLLIATGLAIRSFL